MQEVMEIFTILLPCRTIDHPLACKKKENNIDGRCYLRGYDIKGINRAFCDGGL